MTIVQEPRAEGALAHDCKDLSRPVAKLHTHTLGGKTALNGWIVFLRTDEIIQDVNCLGSTITPRVFSRVPPKVLSCDP